MPGSRIHGTHAPDASAHAPRMRRRVSVVADFGAKRPTDPLLEIYLERRSNLVRFFAARVGSPAIAEDLAQELYVKLATRDPAVTAENPVALIYRIATNVMLDRARGEARSVARDGAWRLVAHDTLGSDDVAADAPADEAVASRQRLRQLVDAVAELPPQMQRAFRLHKLEGRSHADTARVMGISVKSVEKHISAALKALTAKLGR
jgi:RNA polymerase sigma factor (sigma-70 family)